MCGAMDLTAGVSKFDAWVRGFVVVCWVDAALAGGKPDEPEKQVAASTPEELFRSGAFVLRHAALHAITAQY